MKGLNRRCLPRTVDPAEQLFVTSAAVNPDLRTAGCIRTIELEASQHHRCRQTRPGCCKRIAPLQPQLTVLLNLSEPATDKHIRDVDGTEQIASRGITEGELQTCATTGVSRGVINQLQFLIIHPTTGQEDDRGFIVLKQQSLRSGGQKDAVVVGLESQLQFPITLEYGVVDCGQRQHSALLPGSETQQTTAHHSLIQRTTVGGMQTPIHSKVCRSRPIKQQLKVKGLTFIHRERASHSQGGQWSYDCGVNHQGGEGLNGGPIWTVARSQA